MIMAIKSGGSTTVSTGCLCAILLVLGCGSQPPTTPEQSGSFFLSGDVRLAYTLDLPAGTGPFPAVVVGHRFLRGRPEVDARRIGLAGVSQAGWILPHAARDLGGVAFMVLWSGPVCSVGLENYYSALADGTPRSLDEVYALLPSFAGFPGYDPVQALEALDTPTALVAG